MPVHPNSQIDTWLNDYWPTFYVSLTDKENWAYTNYSGSSSETFLRGEFSTLNSLLDSYRQENREEIWNDLMNALYSNYAMQQNFGIGSVNLNNYSYNTIFDFDNFGLLTINRSVNYYNDVVNIGSGLESAKMVDDISRVANAVEEEDVSIRGFTVPSLVTDFRAGVSQFLFEDPPSSLNPASKQDIGNFIFNTLGYKNIYYELDVSPLTLPSYIT